MTVTTIRDVVNKLGPLQKRELIPPVKVLHTDKVIVRCGYFKVDSYWATFQDQASKVLMHYEPVLVEYDCLTPEGPSTEIDV